MDNSFDHPFPFSKKELLISSFFENGTGDQFFFWERERERVTSSQKKNWSSYQLPKKELVNVPVSRKRTDRCTSSQKKN
jgi:hypothetical protein